MEYKIMERKIGEIFEFGGEWYQCCRDENDKCKGCSFLSDKGNLHKGYKWRYKK